MKVVAIASLANILGLFILSSISMLGLGALLLGSSTLFMLVKIIGAMYLIYLGVNQLLAAKNSVFINETKDQTKAEIRSHKDFFLESFFLAATNPKPILFFVALFPQFIVKSEAILPQFILLTAIFMTMSFLILCSYGYLSKRAKGLFAKPYTMKWFHRVTGSLFILMGASLLRLKNS